MKIKISPNVWIRPIILFVITLGMVIYFYVLPGFSGNRWTQIYNIFSALILLATIVLYTLAIRTSFEIKVFNEENLKPGENKKWELLWNLYQSGQLQNHEKTTVPALTYFNANNLLSASAERIPVLAILKSMPGTYTGLGILGTFMGFSAGLANFNTSTTESMQESIKTLLIGINTAFNTSIVGVVLSIIFNFCFLQPLLKYLEQDCNVMADRLDDEFYIDSIDHMKDIFAFNEEGTIWYPRDYNRQMLKELKTQSVSLSNFTTDLSDSIQNLAEALVSSYRKEIGKMFAEDLQPTLSRLATSAEALQADKAESTDQALEGIVNRLNQTLTDFMKDFRENVAGQTKREMEGLASQLNLAGQSIGNLPSMLEGLRGTFLSMTEQSVKTMNDVALQSSSLQSENIAEFRKLADQGRASMESFVKMLAASENQNRHAEKIAASFEEVADAVNVAVADLNRSFSEFKSQNETLVVAIGKEAEGLRTEVAAVETASHGFLGLDEALGKSFEIINTGLKDYREATKDGLDKYLESYSSTFTQFASRMASAVELLGELVEDLQATLEARKRT